MNIGEAARATGLSEHTLRYYEKVGLIPPPRRDGNGLRRYAPQDLRWIGFLQKLRATGMPLKDMCAYAALVGQGDGTAGQRRALLDAHRRRMLGKMEVLTDCLTLLDEKLALYARMEAGQGACCATARPERG